MTAGTIFSTITSTPLAFGCMAEIEIRAFDGIAVVQLARLLVVGIHRAGEADRDVLERNAAFRTLRAGHRRHDVTEIEFQRIGED